MKKKFIKILFKPISLLWEWVYRLRRSAYEYGLFQRVTFKVPVLSVGNLSFGGTGKTPMILWLADLMNEWDLNPTVLTRGYKGNLESGAGLLKSGQRFRLNPHDYGDEPLMLAAKMKSGSVIVGKNRAANLERFFPDVKPDVVLLDDGFQHLKIYRSFNMVLFDASMPLEQLVTAPLGYLREGPVALKDADAIIFSRADQVSSEQKVKLREFLRPYHHHDPLFCEVTYRAVGIFDAFDRYIMNVDELKGRGVLVVTAIASPESFYRSLESYGAQVVDKMAFPDHYYFTSEDVNEILLLAMQKNALVVCSDKDMVKLRRVSLDPRLHSIKVKLEFLSGESELKSQLRKVLHLDQSPPSSTI